MAEVTETRVGLIRSTPFKIAAIPNLKNQNAQFWLLGNKEYFVLDNTILLSRNTADPFFRISDDAKKAIEKAPPNQQQNRRRAADLVENYVNNNVEIHDRSYKKITYNSGGLFLFGQPRNILTGDENANASGFLFNALISPNAKRDFQNNKPLSEVSGPYRRPPSPNPNRPPSGTNPPSAPGQDPGPDQPGSQDQPNTPGSTPPPPALSAETWNNLDIGWAEGAEPREQFGILIYPQNVNTTGQDYIQFDILEYKKRKINPGGIGFARRVFEAPKGTIILPIQSGITDTNAVNWRDDQINTLELGVASASGALQTSGDINSLLDGISKELAEDRTTKIESFKQALITWAARKASNPTGNGDAFLSRTLGAILNNNVELLFGGPLLRSFNYTFRLTPRSANEGKEVRKIIRAFKEASAVQRGVADVFLKTPYVFNIKYIYGGNQNDAKAIHPKLNRIKPCALKSVDINYIPDGTYMSRTDGTMTSYEMVLEFTELEPVYADDYQDIPSFNDYKVTPKEIGF